MSIIFFGFLNLRHYKFYWILEYVLVWGQVEYVIFFLPYYTNSYFISVCICFSYFPWIWIPSNSYTTITHLSFRLRTFIMSTSLVCSLWSFALLNSTSMSVSDSGPFTGTILSVLVFVHIIALADTGYEQKYPKCLYQISPDPRSPTLLQF